LTGSRLLAVLVAAVLAVLLGTAGPPAGATVPGTNGQIGLVRPGNCPVNANLRGNQIFTVNPDGSGLTDLSNNVCAGISDEFPSWSPDGSKIAFVRCCPGGADEVYVMNSNGTDQTALTDASHDDYGPVAWSPDGSQIAFMRTTGSIWIMNADGSGVHRVPDTADAIDNAQDEGFGLAWSPDGTRIAFSSKGLGLVTITPAGTDRADLTNGSTPGGTWPAWSPDGSEIAVSTSGTSCPGYAIWAVKSDGSGGSLVDCPPQGGPGCSAQPAWSPDGTKIACEGDTGDSRAPVGVFTMNSDGSGVTLATPGSEPRWGVPSPATPAVPAAPTGLSASEARSQAFVQLAWTNPPSSPTSGIPTGDVVRRGSVFGLCPATPTDGGAVGGLTLRTSETDPAPGLATGTYCYSVFATNAAGFGPAAYVLVFITPTSVAPPGEPTYHFDKFNPIGNLTEPLVRALIRWTPSSTYGAQYELQVQVNGGSWRTISNGLQATYDLSLGDTYDFRVRAAAGYITTPWVTNTPFTVMGFQDPSLAYTGAWATSAEPQFWGGTDEYTTASKASANLTFSGRTFAIIGSLSSSNGSAALWVDGQWHSRLDESWSSPGTSGPTIVGRWGWTATGTHTIKIVNSATKGHPRFDIDGVVVFQ
jgi:hypothetical protein